MNKYIAALACVLLFPCIAQAEIVSQKVIDDSVIRDIRAFAQKMLLFNLLLIKTRAIQL